MCGGPLPRKGALPVSSPGNHWIVIEAQGSSAHRLGLSVLGLHLADGVSVALDCATVDKPLGRYKGEDSR